MRVTMKHETLMRALIFAGALAMPLTFTAPASAGPALALGPKALSPAVEQELRARVDAARKSDALAFARVRELATRSPAVHARARGRRAPVALALEALGPKATLPMLELLALDAPATVPLEALGQVRLDLIEAVGLLRDARALPVLEAMLKENVDAPTTRALSSAIARLDSDEAASRLIDALTTASGERRTAIAAGMGACRKTAVVRALASELGRAPHDEARIAVIKALGYAGNAWAWKALSPRGHRATEEASVREGTARALVGSFTRVSPAAREAIAKALLVVDAPETPALLAEARRGASAADRAAIDAFAARFAKNPVR